MRTLSVVAVALGLAGSVAARADSVNDLIEVTASGNGNNVSLSYNLTWDPTVNVFTPTAAGLTLLSVTNSNSAFDDAFKVAPAWQFFYEPFGSLEIGGPNPDFGGGLGTTPDTSNYLLDLSFSNGMPSFVSLSVSDGHSIQQLNTGTVTITPPYVPPPGSTAVTPEPSSVALLGTGLLGLAGFIRRRRS